ncbi:MAG: DNA-formamidopyrimidine glycosylase family protein [Desulfonatronovibrio sp.]
MPELPDVEVFRRYLNSTALHKTIEEVEVAGRTGWYYPKCQQK